MQLFLMPEDSKRKTIFVPNEIMEGIGTAVSGRGLLSANESGKIITLNTAEAGKLQLGQTFASLRQVTSSCYAIRNTLLNPIDPKPSWYDELKGKYNDVQDCAKQWLNNYAAAITSTIPLSVMNFAPVFTNSADAISGILNSGTGALNPTDLESIRSIFARLLTKTTAISNDVKIYAFKENGVSKGKLITWTSDMSDAGIALKKGNATVQKAALDLQDKIDEFNVDIKTLTEDIRHYSTLVGTGAGLVGGGAFIATVGGAVCLAFPPAGIVTIIIGGIAIVTGTALWGVYQSKINEASKKIIEKQRKIKANQASIIALSSVSSNMDIIVNNADLAAKNMTEFSTSWLGFSDSLKKTIADIDEGKAENNREMLKLIVEDTKDHWKDAKKYSEKLLDSSNDVTVQEAGKTA